MKTNKKTAIFWFRRDLRMDDNTALYHCLQENEEVMPVFIFDTEITDELPANDPRLYFIYNTLVQINNKLATYSSGVKIRQGSVQHVFEEFISKYNIAAVYCNKDYEAQAIKRDNHIKKLLNKHGIIFKQFKDQVIFEEHEIVKNNGLPYTVFTPYKKKWLLHYDKLSHNTINISNLTNKFCKYNNRFPTLAELHLTKPEIKVPDWQSAKIEAYNTYRDIPYADHTTHVGPYLRFGLISIRKLCQTAFQKNMTYLSELIWREFFMQILFHFPNVVTQNFRSKYDRIVWLNKESDFERWCTGQTGYPMVDAGIRQLNTTGYMHNRLRMITAGFLCKHLLIDWRYGEAYFAKKLLDYELASNNGNWQWAAGTGCDAAPYFRIFNPETQMKRFDKQMKFIKRWIPEWNSSSYCQPIINHKFARERAIATYKKALQ